MFVFDRNVYQCPFFKTTNEKNKCSHNGSTTGLLKSVGSVREALLGSRIVGLFLHISEVKVSERPFCNVWTKGNAGMERHFERGLGFSFCNVISGQDVEKLPESGPYKNSHTMLRHWNPSFVEQSWNQNSKKYVTGCGWESLNAENLYGGNVWSSRGGQFVYSKLSYA